MNASSLDTMSYLDAGPVYGSLNQDPMGTDALAQYAAVFPLEMEAALASQQQQQQAQRDAGGALAFVGQTSDTCFTNAELAHYSTDEFRMFAFKVFHCTKRFAHDWRTCPFSHPTENARRRDPNVFRYSAVACPDYKQGFCMRGELCPHAHGVFECWLHPSRYRTQLCKDGTACSRPLCFFAHSLAELRAPTHTWTPTAEDLQSPHQSHAFPLQHSQPMQPSLEQPPNSPSQSLVQVATQLAAEGMAEGDSTKPADFLHLASTQGQHVHPLPTLAPAPQSRQKPNHHHHHHHHHGPQRGGSSSASALGLTAPRMSNAFARRHGLNPKDSAMLNLQKIAIQQAQLANGSSATLPAAAAHAGGVQLPKGDGSQRGRQQQQAELLKSGNASHLNGVHKSSKTLNHITSSQASNTAPVMPVATDHMNSSNTTSGMSSNQSSSNSSLHLSNLSADSNGAVSSSNSNGSSNGNSSQLGIVSTAPTTNAHPYLSREATVMHGSMHGSSSRCSRQPVSAHFMAAGAATSPPFMNIGASLNRGSSGNRGHSTANGDTSSHKGMMLPLAWPVTAGGRGDSASSSHADASTLAALEQQFQAFSFQRATLHEQTQQQPMGYVASFGAGSSSMPIFNGSGIDRGASMTILQSSSQQQQNQQLLAEYMHSIQGCL